MSERRKRVTPPPGGVKRDVYPGLKVAEIFSSIEGETSRAGLPCAFVRLAGCNLSCRYCDTPYARNGGEEVSIGDVISRVNEMDHHLVCVTGGEPLLQEGARPLVAGLLKLGHEVLVETNGSMPVSILPARAIKIVDVKTPGSGEGGSFYSLNLEHVGPRDELKFVVTDRRDFNWALSFIRRHRLAGRCELLISPAYGFAEPAELARWIVQSGLPLRLNLQLHKILWGGNARGV